MTRALLLTFCLLSSFAPLHASAVNDSPLSRHALQDMVRSAHSPSDYARLCKYFTQQARRFELLALSEQQKLERELEHPTSGTKFPNEADRARRWRDYYRQQGTRMKSAAMKYSLKSVPVDAKMAPAAVE